MPKTTPRDSSPMPTAHEPILSAHSPDASAHPTNTAIGSQARRSSAGGRQLVNASRNTITTATSTAIARPTRNEPTPTESNHIEYTAMFTSSSGCASNERMNATPITTATISAASASCRDIAPSSNPPPSTTATVVT